MELKLIIASEKCMCWCYIERSFCDVHIYKATSEDCMHIYYNGCLPMPLITGTSHAPTELYITAWGNQSAHISLQPAATGCQIEAKPIILHLITHH